MHFLYELRVKIRRSIEDRNLRMLLLTNFSKNFSTSLINPLMPLFISSLGANKLEVSLVLSASSTASVFLLVPSGILADRYGKKKTILISIILSFISPFFFAISTEWEQIIPWAILFSASAAIYFPAKDSIIADYTTAENRPMFYGAINMALCAASIIAPIIGGFIIDNYGWACSFYLVILTSAICLIFALGLTETTGKGESTTKKRKDIDLRGQYLRILAFFVIYYICLGISLAIFFMAIPLYLEDRFHMNKTQIGLFFSAGMGLTPLLTQIPSGRIVKRFGGRRSLLLYIMMIIPTLIAWPSIQRSSALLALMIIFGGLYAMTWVAEATLIMSLVPSSLRGFSSAVTYTALSVGRTIGPIVAGSVWTYLGSEAVFYLSALFLSLCIPPIFLIKQQPNKRED